MGHIKNGHEKEVGTWKKEREKKKLSSVNNTSYIR
jgi:hypothetical protein